jgi:hypothetical protein
LDLKCPLKAHVLKTWSPVVRGGALRKWLDHKASGLIDGLIH